MKQALNELARLRSQMQREIDKRDAEIEPLRAGLKEIAALDAVDSYDQLERAIVIAKRLLQRKD